MIGDLRRLGEGDLRSPRGDGDLCLWPGDLRSPSGDGDLCLCPGEGDL